MRLAFRELQEFLYELEPSGSNNVSGAPVKEKKSRSYPKILDSRNVTYDEMIEQRDQLNEFL